MGKSDIGTKKRRQPAVLAAILLGLLVAAGGFYWFERAFVKAAPWLEAVRRQPLGDLTFELPANLEISHSSWAFQPRNDLWPHMTVAQEFTYPSPAGPAAEDGETGRAGIERAYLAQAAEFSSRQSWPFPTQEDLAGLAGRPATLICASALDQSQQRAYLLVWFPDGYLEIIKHGFNQPDQPSHCQRLANYSGQLLSAYAWGHNDPAKTIHTGRGQFEETYFADGLDYFSPKIKLHDPAAPEGIEAFLQFSYDLEFLDEPMRPGHPFGERAVNLVKIWRTSGDRQWTVRAKQKKVAAYLGPELVTLRASARPEAEAAPDQLNCLYRPKTGLIAQWAGHDELSRRQGRQKQFIVELTARNNYPRALGVWNLLLSPGVPTP